MNEFKQAIPLLMLLGIYFLVRHFGGATLGKKRVYRTYEDVLIDKDTNEVFIVVKNRILFFDRNRTYRLKYIRAKCSQKDMKEYMDNTLKGTSWLLREIIDRNPFVLKKMAGCYIKDTSNEVFNKVSPRFLPGPELKNIIIELLDLELVELDEADFATFGEKIMLKRFLEAREKNKGGK